MANIDTNLTYLNRGGFPALGSKVGVMEVTDIDVTGLAIGDTIEVALSESDCIVSAAGVEVLTPTTGATIGTLGDGTSAALFGTTTTLAVAGNKFDATAGAQLLTAGSKLILTLTVEAPVTGVLRVWALVADVEDLRG